MGACISHSKTRHSSIKKPKSRNHKFSEELKEKSKSNHSSSIQLNETNSKKKNLVTQSQNISKSAQDESDSLTKTINQFSIIFQDENSKIPSKNCALCKKETKENIQLCKSHYFCTECINLESFRRYLKEICKKCYKSAKKLKKSGSSIPDEEESSKKFSQSKKSVIKCISCSKSLIKDKYSINECKIHKYCLHCISDPDLEKIWLSCKDCFSYFKNQKSSKFSSCRQVYQLSPAIKTGQDLNFHQSTPKNSNSYLLSPNGSKSKEPGFFHSCKQFLFEDSNDLYEYQAKSKITKHKESSSTNPYEIGCEEDAEIIVSNENLHQPDENLKNQKKRKKKSKKTKNSTEKQEVVKTEDKQQDINDFPIPLQRNDSIFLIILSCNICNQDTNNIIGFLCNHNICEVCLTWKCLKDIYEFFEVKKKNDETISKGVFNVEDIKMREVLLKNFHYYCPVEQCNSVISVPTKMIEGNLRRYLNNSYFREKFVFFEYILEVIEEWIPFFDGLDFIEVYFR